MPRLGSPPPMWGLQILATTVAISVGSPPHRRGLRPWRVLRQECFGITPAYAGPAVTTTDLVCMKGSPPPMRGQAVVGVFLLLAVRFTPTWVGSASMVRPTGDDRRVHPQSCGVCGDGCPSVVTDGGSPPPMRGLHGLVEFLQVAVGLTPGWAGSARPANSFSSLMREYPRLCGACLPLMRMRWHQAGSPPPMRGLRFRVQFACRLGGITPAYAGPA